MDYPSSQEEKKYMPNTESYIYTFDFLKEKYQQKIKILSGVGIGLVPYPKSRIIGFVNKYKFSLIIGSSQLVNGGDPFYKAKEEKFAYLEYFKSILENVKIIVLIQNF